MTEWQNHAADWVSLHEALRRILDSTRPLPPERVSLTEALGRTLAEDIRSPVEHPPWDNSAMDGFAVRAEDIRGASEERPVTLEIIEDVPAGGFPRHALGRGQAAKIMTGAPVPEGADGVVRVEHTDAWKRHEDEPSGGGTVTIYSDADAGRNIRRRGEDLRAGTVVLAAGSVVRPAEAGVLAAIGRTGIQVHRRPRIGILSNGDELVEPDAFHQVLAGRRIVNSNAYALAAAVSATGGVPVLLGIARDDEASLHHHLEAGLGLDALVTTAGASVGEHDLMKKVLEALGLELDFWRVRIRPGSPFSFGRIGSTIVFGLPGNPVSAVVTFEVLVRPALRRMLGRRVVHNPLVTVRAAERIASKPGLVHFLRVRLESDPDGGLLARLTGPQGSGILMSLAQADALLIVPEDSEGIEAGAPATVMPLAGPDPAQDAESFYRQVSKESQ